MNISCIYSKPEDLGDEYIPGKLRITATSLAAPIFLDPKEFDNYYEKALEKKDPNINEPIVAKDGSSELNKKGDVIPFDFRELLEFLRTSLNLTEDNFSQDNELYINSDYYKFLQIPWERISASEVFVFRRVKREAKPQEIIELKEDNILILSSIVSEWGDYKCPDIKEMGIHEILSIGRRALNTEPKSWNVSDICIVNHTTRSKLDQIQYDKYKHLHFIAHGISEGGILLENEDIERYKEGQVINSMEIVNLLKEKKFGLLFFSCCYSAGGVNEEGSLVFQIVKNGIAKYSLGYMIEIIGSYAKDFVRLFYKQLELGTGIENGHIERLEEAYKIAMGKYYEQYPDCRMKNRIPMLYLS